MTENLSTIEQMQTGCLLPLRLWQVGFGQGAWTAEECEHLVGCARCQRRLQEVLAAIRRRRAGPVEEAAATAGGSGAATPTAAAGFTTLARQGQWSRLRENLRPLLPVLLELLGLRDRLASALLEHLLERAKAIGDERFGDLLPRWLEEFARAQGQRKALPPLDWAALAERAAVLWVLAEAPAEEPDWARRFRQEARRAATAQELLHLALPPDFPRPSSLAPFQRELAARVQRQREETLALLELN